MTLSPVEERILPGPRAEAAPPASMLCPDFPFAYDDWLRHPAGLGRVPRQAHGTEVAVIGGGLSGMVAAYELMKLGLKPVIYEAEQLGGRMRSVSLPGYPDAVAELGAMRFPPSAGALFHYIDKVGLETTPFPNPLSPASPSTVINLHGENHWARTSADLPPVYREVNDAWTKTLQEQADMSLMEDAIRRRDISTIKDLWNHLVTKFDNVSFYGFLTSSPLFSSFEHREIFGQVGFGCGGWDTDFPNSALEILRVICTDTSDEHHRILGGCQQLPLGLWADEPADLEYWPSGTSLKSLHGGEPRPAVVRIDRTGRGFTIEDADRDVRTYPAAIFAAQNWNLLSGMKSDDALLPQPVWTALERTHYMGASKLFVITDRPFWLDQDPATGRDVMSTTLTDRIPRGVYLIDNGPDEPGTMLLSYTWNDDSLKVASLSPDERLDVMLSALAKIYPGVDIRSHMIGPPIAITWETQPHFKGAFKSCLPGSYRYQRRLFTQFMQRDAAEHHRGFFLAGDDVAWIAGFSESAVTTALNAVWGVVEHLGGGTHPDNPGPGDVFDEIAPVSLD
ncbi:NAD(P)/FAD-dependent oxidoreductase [Amycolatopsis roodepoortensis]|uniref:flavin monoamine oxidase family protein n=1 Tax=Amycolatopsis roodepoortensis TaxID=700274 RepID=UPI000F87C170|nr:NAD(P)/FAD-dependent oxidoreductase [Amycolatopsis roodepoortensis]RSN11254.1 amine oxidase [Streptomyces sp. WAC 05977]UUV33314.1 NAD(P)/FAD-dependent oxidoreductase [Amycolatopsis roodepoortensis]